MNFDLNAPPPPFWSLYLVIDDPVDGQCFLYAISLSIEYIPWCAITIDYVTFWSNQLWSLSIIPREPMSRYFQ